MPSTPTSHAYWPSTPDSPPSTTSTTYLSPTWPTRSTATGPSLSSLINMRLSIYTLKNINLSIHILVDYLGTKRTPLDHQRNHPRLLHVRGHGCSCWHHRLRQHHKPQWPKTTTTSTPTLFLSTKQLAPAPNTIISTVLYHGSSVSFHRGSPWLSLSFPNGVFKPQPFIFLSTK